MRGEGDREQQLRGRPAQADRRHHRHGLQRGPRRLVRRVNARSLRPMDDGVVYELLRLRTRDGGDTTVYLLRYPLATTRVSAVVFGQPERLDRWCAATRHPEAIVGGFFLRD